MTSPQDRGLYFNGTTRKSLIGFSDMFNEIYTVVDAPDPSNRNNRIFQNYLVPVRLTTKERFLAFYRNIEQRRQIGISLPTIGFNLSSFAIDPERTHMPINKVYSTDGKEWVFQPVPTTLSIEMNVWTKTIGELLDIMEWIVPKYQTPRSYPLIELKFFDGSMIQRDMMVSLDSPSLNITDTDLAAQDGDRIIQASLNFTVTSTIYHVVVNSIGSLTGSFSGPNSENASALGVRGNSAVGNTIEVINVEFESMIGERWEDLQITPTGSTLTVY